jgi:transposase
MKKVEKISESEKKNLEEIKKHHPKYRERERARGIMLSYRGYSPKEIAKIFEISDRMVYNWIDNFNENGIIGVVIQKGQGRKPILKKNMKRK